MATRTENPTFTPQANLAEARLLSAILTDNNCAFEAMSLVRPEDFYLEPRRRMFSMFCKLAEQGKPFDHKSVYEALDKAKKLDSVGGWSGFDEISEALGLPRMVSEYATEIVNAAKHRSLIRVLSESLDKATCGEYGPDEIIANVQNFTLSSVRFSPQESVSEIAQRVMTHILDIRSGQRLPGGISTSLTGLDEITAGIKPAEYIIIAGRTGQGKSSLARQITLHAAKNGHRPLFCTIEMSRENLVQCMAASESQVPFELIQDPRFMTDAQLEKVAEAMKRIQELPFDIEDMAGVELSELCARIRARIVRGYDLIFVDFLQIIRVHGADGDYDRVTKASAALRELAAVTKVPVVALSQLRRPGDGKESIPTIYGLKESGNIENDAFQVWLIYRPKQNNGEGSEWYTKKDQIIVGKNRNGPCDSIPVEYEGPFLTFKMRTP